MKKFIILIGVVMTILFSNISFANGISGLGNNKNEIPYNIDCKSKGCLQKGIDDTKDILKDSYKNGKAADHIQNIVAYLLGFLYFIGVIIIIYAGFIILTANGDEEKVSKAKKIILYVVIGMVVIFLAGPITNFVLDMFNSST